MRFELSVTEGTTILRPIGNQSDRATMDEWSQIKEVLHRHTGWVILDFTAVTYLASASLRDVLEIRTHASREGGGVVMVGVGPQLQGIFRVTGIVSLFEWMPDLESAVSYCEKQRGSGAEEA